MRKELLKWLIAVPLLAAVLIPIVGWQIEARRAQRRWSPAKSRRANLPIPVRTSEVREEDVVDVIGGTCLSLPMNIAKVSVFTSNNEVSHRLLTEVYVAEGDAVDEGQALFNFDTTLFEQILKDKRAAVAMSQAQVDNLQSILAAGAASMLELRLAEAQLESSKLSVELATSDLEQCAVTSPLKGIVGQINLPAGVRVPGNSESLAIVYQLDPILVRMDFPLERLDSLHVGQKADVVLDSFPEKTYTGIVTRIAPNVAAQTRVIHAYVELPNPDLRLRGGITGYVRLKTTKQQSLIVPRTAVIRRKDRAVVFVIENDRARLREISVGAMVKQGFLEVHDGLQAGHHVVIFGQDDLRDGDRVDTDWKTWAQRDDLREKEAEELEGVDESADIADESIDDDEDKQAAAEPERVASTGSSELETGSRPESE